MKYLVDLLPDTSELLTMRVERLGYEVLEVLQSWENDTPMYQPHISHFSSIAINAVPIGRSYGHSNSDAEIKGAITRAWNYLTTEGYLIQKPDYGSGVYMLSGKAHALLATPRRERYFPNLKINKDYLHQRLQAEMWDLYQTGNYEMAVFAAMRAVEIATRDVLQPKGHPVGVNLMRQAFHADTGKLTDMDASGGERHALCELFTGAIGLFKNPSSHRAVEFDDPDTAVELILFANHLLRIVDARQVANL